MASISTVLAFCGHRADGDNSSTTGAGRLLCSHLLWHGKGVQMKTGSVGLARRCAEVLASHLKNTVAAGQVPAKPALCGGLIRAAGQQLCDRCARHLWALGALLPPAGLQQCARASSSLQAIVCIENTSLSRRGIRIGLPSHACPACILRARPPYRTCRYCVASPSGSGTQSHEVPHIARRRRWRIWQCGAWLGWR